MTSRSFKGCLEVLFSVCFSYSHDRFDFLDLDLFHSFMVWEVSYVRQDRKFLMSRERISASSCRWYWLGVLPPRAFSSWIDLYSFIIWRLWLSLAISGELLIGSYFIFNLNNLYSCLNLLLVGFPRSWAGGVESVIELWGYSWSCTVLLVGSGLLLRLAFD